VVAVDALAQSQAVTLVIQATADAGATKTDSEEVARRLAEGAAALLARGGFAAVIVSGGDTAVALLQRLRQPALRVMGTLLAGIPYSKIAGPQGELVIVTKSGGFGTPDTFSAIASQLRAV
jgi:D-threonate/D-erythronate kinase